MVERRASSVSTKRWRPSVSPSYHSSGMSAASRQISFASICSARVSVGSNASHPDTFLYTQLSAYTPLSGQSGKVHSPALKQ
jgi:hypothetical protein